MRISDWSSYVCSSVLLVGADLVAAEQPRLQLASGRAIGVGVVEQRQPRLLLALARQGQMAHGRGVDLFLTVKVADARPEIAERADALHRQLGHSEGCRNIRLVAAFADQPHAIYPELGRAS